MSIDDLPLVVSYRNVIGPALQTQQDKGNNENLGSILEAIRTIRIQDTTPEDAPAHDAAIDSVVRESFIDMVARLDIHGSEYRQVWNLIDVVNGLSDEELCEPGLGFHLIEELLDSQTIDGCRKVFDYLESRRERMVRKNFKSKSLVILRCCNELLRRLSRAEETVFCGRVFIYLFQTFPLGDRSSVNLRGVFHVENVTTYDTAPQKSDNAIKPMEIDSDVGQQITSRAQTPSSSVLDPDQKTSRSTPSVRGSKTESKQEMPPDLDALYPIFWSLQGLFSDPTRLFDPQSMQQLKDGLSATMACFRYVAKTSTPSTEPQDIRRGQKRKHDDTNGDNTSAVASTFNPKYLTSRDLFDLEIHDIAFRRHILVQALILIDFLLSLSPTAKTKTVGLTNKSVLYTHTLSEEDTKWAQSTRSSIATYLQQSGIGSEGSLYYRMVDTVLARDKNWARWKAENCPLISRPSIEVKTYVEAQKSLQQLSTNKPLPTPPGADEFAFLSRVQPLEALKHPAKRHRVPTMEEYYKGIQSDELDLEMAMDDDEKSELQERKAGKLWRALRAATGRRFVLCEEIKNGDNLGALVGQGLENKSNGELEAAGHTEQEVKMEEVEDRDAVHIGNEAPQGGAEGMKSEMEVDVETQEASGLSTVEASGAATSASSPELEHPPASTAGAKPDGNEATIDS